MNNVVEFANQVLDMQQELIFLRKENEMLRKYKDDYLELLVSSQKHSDIMRHQVVQAILDNCTKSKERM